MTSNTESDPLTNCKRCGHYASLSAFQKGCPSCGSLVWFQPVQRDKGYMRRGGLYRG